MRFSRKLHICAIKCRESEALTLDLEPSKSSFLNRAVPPWDRTQAQTHSVCSVSTPNQQMT